MAGAAEAVAASINVALNDSERWLSARLHDANRAGRALLMLGFACTRPDDEEMLSRLSEAITREEAVSSELVLRAAASKLSSSSRARLHLESLLGASPAAASLTWLPALDDERLRYVAPPALVRHIATSIALVTQFGTLPGNWPPSLVDTLAFWVFCSMRDDDLDLLCPILRALLFLGSAHLDECHDAIQFILSHQREDGRFSAQELSLLQCSRKTANFDFLHDAYLPMTVASVWTLKEANAFR